MYTLSQSGDKMLPDYIKDLDLKIKGDVKNDT